MRSHGWSNLWRFATQRVPKPSIWDIIVVISDHREFETTRARSNGRSMVLLAGGGALVRAAATFVSAGLRARHECLGPNDAVLHVLLPGPSPARTYSGVFPAPRDNF